MARIARVVVPGMPHHVTQRGNRRMPAFFCDEDYAAYLATVGFWCRKEAVAVWAYCLMPNHVHLILVPSTTRGLARALGEAHRRYTLRVNSRISRLLGRNLLPRKPGPAPQNPSPNTRR